MRTAGVRPARTYRIAVVMLDRTISALDIAMLVATGPSRYAPLCALPQNVIRLVDSFRTAEANESTKEVGASSGALCNRRNAGLRTH